MGAFSSQYKLDEYEHIDLDYLERTAQTGDLILVSGTSFFSFLIKLFTGTPWTHIGVIIRIKNKVYVFQALNSSNKTLPDYFEKSAIKQGVQMNLLRETVLADKGKIYFRKLIIQGQQHLSQNQTMTFIKENVGKSYEECLIEMANSVRMGNTSSNILTYFCSELVAQYYINMNLASNKHSFSNNYTPDSFTDMYNHEFPFRSGVSLGPMKKIVVEKKPLPEQSTSRIGETYGETYVPIYHHLPSHPSQTRQPLTFTVNKFY